MLVLQQMSISFLTDRKHSCKERSTTALTGGGGGLFSYIRGLPDENAIIRDSPPLISVVVERSLPECYCSRNFMSLRSFS